MSHELHTDGKDTDASMLYWVPSPSVNMSWSIVHDLAFNVLMRTVVYADPLEDQLAE
jgi:hypothetical protein